MGITMFDSPRLWYGGDWNPEQWPREAWTEDLELMVQAGVNLVTLGVFSWSKFQPAPDEWEFDWFDELLDLTQAAGITVDLATPSASPPPWFSQVHPDGLAIDRTGQRYSHGSRNHFCPSSPAYRGAALELARRLAERYGEHPAVRMWHVGNEYGQECLCEVCAAEFRSFLQGRHGSLAALNQAWGTAFWSQHYGDWSQVIPPRHVPYRHNPAHLLDWHRFVNHQLLTCYTEQAQLLRQATGLPVTTNFMGLFGLVDPWTWTSELDVVSDDHYVDPSDPQAPARAALTHDLMRSLAGEGPWLIMEQAMGAVNWRPANQPKTDQQRRADVLRAVGHGANGVLSFQWRQSRAGAERFHSAMLPIQGPDTQHHRQVREIGAALGRLGAVAQARQQPRVALVFDWDSWWAMSDPGLPTQALDPRAILEAWHRPLWRRGFVVDVVPPDRVADHHQLVLAPCAHLLSDEAIASLRGRIQAGQAVVFGPFSSVVDEHCSLRQGHFPVGFTDLLGARGEQWWPLSSPLELSSEQFGAGVVADYAEQLVLAGGTAWARVEHPVLDPIVVASAEHPFWYVAGLLDESTLDRFLAAVIDQVGVEPDLGVLGSLPEQVEVAVRGDFCFVISHRDDPVELDLETAVHDLLHGAVGRSMTLAPRGCLVLERQEHEIH